MSHEVSVKHRKPAPSAREAMAKSDPQPPVQETSLVDRRGITVRWLSRRAGRWLSFTGEIRVLGLMDLMNASTRFAKVTNGVPYDQIPSEVRSKMWPVAKLVVMFDGQKGSEALLDDLESDTVLLSAVLGEVTRLESDCFLGVLVEGEGEPGAPRVVVATSRIASAPEAPGVAGA